MSQGMKETFESYGPKEYQNKVTIKRVIGSVHTPWSIPTLEGTMTASVGDYIIEGVNGEYYPCKPEIFAKSYEPAST